MFIYRWSIDIARMSIVHSGFGGVMTDRFHTTADHSSAEAQPRRSEGEQWGGARPPNPRAATTAYHPGMYLDALEFLDEERDAWRRFEALADLTDEQLTVPVEAAHGWMGRQLMGHLLSGHEVALAVATELAVNETSPARERAEADWDARGGEVVNAEIDATWAARSMDELRDRFATLPGQLRGSLTVVPESRWLEHGDHQRFFRSETTAHYEDHLADLAAILAEAGR
jgi:hypothetical protein